jgi:hypothetical protein
MGDCKEKDGKSKKGLRANDFRFMQVEMNDGVSNPRIPVVTSATNKDHDDIHYLYRMRKALLLLVGNENMQGFDSSQLQQIHEAIVRSMTDNGRTHWYSSWDSDLDSTLPEDLKLASEGYEPPSSGTIFDLEELEELDEQEQSEELAYLELLEEEGAVALWTAPTARKNVPKGYFLDPANKKYPYKNSDGTINCGGLMAAYKAARGARGAPKRSGIAVKAKNMLKSKCGKAVGEKKKAEALRIGHLSKF